MRSKGKSKFNRQKSHNVKASIANQTRSQINFDHITQISEHKAHPMYANVTIVMEFNFVSLLTLHF